MSPVCLDDALCDCEAEAGAAAAGGDAVELLEDLVFLSSREPRTVIRDLYGDGLPGRGSQDANGAAARSVLDRVVEQVDQHLLDQHVVDWNERQIGRYVRVHAPIG